jgi:hypothetical protein
MPANLLAELLLFATIAASSLAILAGYNHQKFTKERAAATASDLENVRLRAARAEQTKSTSDALNLAAEANRQADKYRSIAIAEKGEQLPVTINREEAHTLLRFIKIALDNGAANEFLDEFSADVFVRRMTARFRKIADAPRSPAAP